MESQRSPAASVAFTPGRIGALTLRNRVIKTATYEGMCPDGVPSGALLNHHRELAAGGVGMTTVAYCSVSPDGRTFSEQMFMREEILPPLRALTDAVHAEGAAASIQLGHCGAFSKNRLLTVPRPLGPSFRINSYGIAARMPFADAMTQEQIASTAEDYARAAAMAVRAGFDAVEIHMGHGYLLSQFLCPAVNRRRDDYGGSLENRMRFPITVLRRVREAVGSQTAVLAKTNLSDGFKGGLEVHEAVAVAQALEREGVDALVLSGGFTSRTPLYLLRGGRPLKEMIEVDPSRLQKLAMRCFGPFLVRAYPFEEMFFLAPARQVRAAVRIPLVLLGGIVSLDNLEAAMAEGFEFVAMGRALIADPSLVRDMQRGRVRRTRCDACNKCIAEMDRGGVRCVLDSPAPT
jgi:2,4-dienoyl-CoA reductase-like NADH-dependent reductase (Old Yellow Enzyme family)